jgi:hypothetical protein
MLSEKTYTFRCRLAGRDIYDLLWYLSDPSWPAPNLTLLNHALQQTGWPGSKLTEDNWREVLRHRLQTLAWDRVVADVRPFLESETDVSLLTRENVMRVLDKNRSVNEE